MKRGGFLARKTSLKATGRPVQRGKVKRLPKVAKTPISKLKKQLWQLCRAIIIKRYGSDCYTCPAVALIGSNRHVGHFISSSICSTELRFSLDNLRPQCYACNIHRSGNWVAFESHLIRDGIDTQALKQRNYDTKGLKYGPDFYLSKIAEYEPLLKE